MAVADKLRRSIDRMPVRMQEELLDYAEYLLSKVQREAETQDNQEWSRFSLANAVRGMEDEDEPAYSESDLKERFSS